MGTLSVVKGHIEKGKLKTDSDMVILEGREVIIISKSDFDVIAGSDSARHRAEVAEQAIVAARNTPDKAQEILAQLEVIA